MEAYAAAQAWRRIARLRCFRGGRSNARGRAIQPCGFMGWYKKEQEHSRNDKDKELNKAKRMVEEKGRESIKKLKKISKITLRKINWSINEDKKKSEPSCKGSSGFLCLERISLSHSITKS